MKNYDYIIFDMDGTLYPYNDTCRTVYKDMAVNLIEKHYELSKEEAEKQFLKLREEEEIRCRQRVSNTLVLLNNFSKIEFTDVEEEINRIYNVEEVLEPDTKAIESVSLICNRYHTALYTMNNEETARRTLNTIEMAGLFPEEKRYTFSTMGKLELPREQRIAHIKPGLMGYKLVLNDLQADPSKCLMVGDSMKSDIEPARAMGMDGYLIRRFGDLYALPQWLEIE